MPRNSYGWTVILTLIALRVGIGMHFFREGLNKVRDPKPFSAGFFGNAKGPLADQFHRLVWDRDGLARLDYKKTITDWEQYRAQVERHFGFNDTQKKQADRFHKRSEDQLREHFDTHGSEIDEYFKNLARRDRYKADRQRMEVPSLREQVEKIESELRTTRTKLVAPIDLMWAGFTRDMNSIASLEQRKAGLMSLDRPGRRVLDSETIDQFIPWFDMTIGALLIIGFATRFAAVIGGAFLCSVIVSQWPTSPGTIATWPQFIELLGLLVVAATGAGRFAGVDGILGMLRRPRGNVASRERPKRAVVA